MWSPASTGSVTNNSLRLGLVAQKENFVFFGLLFLFDSKQNRRRRIIFLEITTNDWFQAKHKIREVIFSLLKLITQIAGQL